MKHLIIFIIISLQSLLWASDTEILRAIDVRGKDNGTRDLLRSNNDTSSLLEMTPGVSFQTGGGISSLPVIHGMADDRVNIKIDGANITASCPNHMNPALSYIDPDKVESLEVFAGISPVSFGGDSLGSSILIKTDRPEFSTSERLLQDLIVKSFFRSNNENLGASIKYSIGSRKNYVAVEAMDESANNYRDGNGKRLKSTLYNRNNQILTLARKLDEGIITFKYSHTIVPYEGFINQRMDMKNNVSNHYSLNYQGNIGAFLMDSTIYYQHTNHFMDILRSQRDGSMPMHTRSDEGGYNIKFSTEFNKNHLLIFGSDFNRYRLDDWWPPLPGVTSIMGPENFESIDNGKRDRLGLFIEADSDWSKNLSTNIGIRTDIVSMNTGKVEGYNNTDNLPADAQSFNRSSRAKTDHNYDATFTSRYKASQGFDLEFGIGRKSRSPNLYERYAWAGTVTDPTNVMDMSSMGAAMDMLMINWFGDGNGYVGNVDLKPEVAHKVSASFIAHDEKSETWEARLSPYVSDIKNFIDADLIGTSMGNRFLRFANHDALVMGADASIELRFNEYKLLTIASYTRGYRKDGKADLYHLMPLNGKVLLQRKIKKWTSEVIIHLVNKKDQVNDLRGEPETPGYALLDLGLSYRANKFLKLDFGISNLLNHHYALPLGGVDLVNYSIASRTPASGMGRSFNTGVTFDF